MNTKQQLQTLNQVVYSRIQSLELPNPLRERILNEELPQHQRDYLIPLCYSLSPAFGEIDEEDQITISTAIFLGAMGIYLLDPILDLQMTGSEIKSPLCDSILAISASQQLLNEVIPAKSRFWNKFQERLRDHFHEVSLSSVKKTGKKAWNQAAYHELLKFKYSLLYLPLDALFHLTNEKAKTNYYYLREALFYFTIGFNIPNEIIGFTSDTTLGLKNYAWVHLSEYLENENLDKRLFTAEELHKLIYLSGIATALYDEALEAFDECLSTVKPMNLPLFERIVHERIKVTIKEKEAINTYLQNIS
ncbi:hypothetical protein [Lunatimonas salinarum]|uniref:hypothetical protein n=1 Tax=Lunatimonas salinarum TaxID=1774590 RepID=UPI001ADF9665|nr:hypothetical protein [Lunatimonas salinarum]